MRPRLRISKFDAADYSVGKRFRFAVADLDRGKDYPVNFICLLPSQLKPKGRDLSVFWRVFGEESLPVAKRLLADTLKKEDEPEDRGKVERRLRLLEPKSAIEKACVSCGKLFTTESRKWFRQKFCPSCFKKRFGD